MPIKVKKVKAPIRRKKIGRQKQKQRQTVSVNVNIDQSKRTTGTKRIPIIKEPPKLSISPTFYSQPNPIPTLNNNIIRDEILRNQQAMRLSNYNRNINNLNNINNFEVEEVIENLVSDNPTTNRQEIVDWNKGVDQKLKTEPMNITFLNQEEKSDNALGNLVYKEKKSQEEKLVDEAFDKNLEQEEDEKLKTEPTNIITLKTGEKINMKIYPIFKDIIYEKRQEETQRKINEIQQNLIVKDYIPPKKGRPSKADKEIKRVEIAIRKAEEEKQKEINKLERKAKQILKENTGRIGKTKKVDLI